MSRPRVELPLAPLVGVIAALFTRTVYALRAARGGEPMDASAPMVMALVTVASAAATYFVLRWLFR